MGNRPILRGDKSGTKNGFVDFFIFCPPPLPPHHPILPPAPDDLAVRRNSTLEYLPRSLPRHESLGFGVAYLEARSSHSESEGCGPWSACIVVYLLPSILIVHSPFLYPVSTPRSTPGSTVSEKGVPGAPP